MGQTRPQPTYRVMVEWTDEAMGVQMLLTHPRQIGPWRTAINPDHLNRRMTKLTISFVRRMRQICGVNVDGKFKLHVKRIT